MKTLYFDCFSGISGDMTIGALLDLGLDFDYLKTEIRKLPIAADGKLDLRCSQVVRANIGAIKFDAVADEGPSHRHGDGPSHVHRHEVHAQDPGGEHHTHDHLHRKASEIIAMVQQSRLPKRTRELAVSIFEKLALSEGRVHRMPPDDVEFHEVGALDSIVDVVGTALGFDGLDIERFLCSPINVGTGFIRCQHGTYPVPAPATADLLRGAPLYSRHVDAELVTPTGAAILAATVDQFARLEGFEIQKIGYGAGTKSFEAFPNCLRLFLGIETAFSARVSEDEVVVMETNIDDMSAEELAYTSELLLSAGALDVITIPILMKKGRPGHLIQVLANAEQEAELSSMIFKETTTIGIRRRSTSRRVLDREIVDVETHYGSVAVKVARFEGRVVNVSPEYEDCARLARETGRPFRQVHDEALKSFQATLNLQVSPTSDNG